MELDNILKLIDAVSESNLTDFSFEEGNVKLTLGRNKKNNIIQNTSDDAPADEEENAVSGGNIIECPLVGIYYSAASPDEEPFVRVGDTVKKGQILGIVEAMKLMNEIECEYDGVVKQILVENEQMVEYGQPMFVIE